MCSQKTWSDQAHVMVGKCAQPEKKINRARTRNPTQLDSHQLAVQCSEEAGYPVPRRREEQIAAYKMSFGETNGVVLHLLTCPSHLGTSSWTERCTRLRRRTPGKNTALARLARLARINSLLEIGT